MSRYRTLSVHVIFVLALVDASCHPPVTVLGPIPTGIQTTNALNLRHTFTKEVADRSDHANFRLSDISALAFFTGFHRDYHRTTDVVAKLDVRGIGKVTDVAEAVVRFAADRK